MGMAAGQARLLSITSRMSDNELRAQIINNEKMRLATQSSQVSEAYVAALNEAQLMFTNYDADNNASYQQLTFNSLTAYNQYNNQYGLSNASGQILVSESDAINFQNSGGNLNTFLSYYGLQETTTYFEDLAQYENNKMPANADNPDGTAERTGNSIKYYTGNTYLDEDENDTWVERPEEADSNMTAEELENIYFGTETTPSYAETVSTQLYHDYLQGITDYQMAYSTFKEDIGPKLQDVINDVLSDNSKASGWTISNLSDKGVLKALAEEYKQYVTDSAVSQLDTLIDEIDTLGAYKTTTYSNATITKVAQGDTNISDINTDTESTYNPGYIYVVKDSAGQDLFAFSGSGNYGTYIYFKDEAGNWSGMKDSHYGGSSNQIKYNSSSGGFNYKYADGDYGERYSFTIDNSALAGLATGASISGVVVTEKTKDNATDLARAQTIQQELESILFNNVAPMKCRTLCSSYTACETAGNRLFSALFGETPTGNFDYSQLLDPDWIQNVLDNGGYYKPEGSTTGTYIANANNPEFLATKANFENIQNALMLDNIMSTYGEPQWAWIDMTSPTDSYNENGEAKAQWYTNLFERMQKGYQVLQDGLASSSEWIQFAFESGIVNLEQVDSDNNWQTTNYTNCSDITEQTNDAAVTIAEAEYNAAMNKIENKDKRYDLELKNIDTEHNSLQTEYDSIKSAIDKNIERTFKIYS